MARTPDRCQEARTCTVFSLTRCAACSSGNCPISYIPDLRQRGRRAGFAQPAVSLTRSRCRGKARLRLPRCAERFAPNMRRHIGSFPSLMLLENHGVFFRGRDDRGDRRACGARDGNACPRVTSEPDFTERLRDAGGFKVSDAVAVAVEPRYRFNLCVVFSRSKASFRV